MKNFYTEVYNALYKFGYHSKPGTTCAKGLCTWLINTAKENEKATLQWDKDRIKVGRRSVYSNPRSSINFNSVLDVGCAKGWAMSFLQSHGKRVAGVDPSLVAVNYVKRNLKMECSQATADCLPYPDNSFDLVMSTDVFEHFREEDVHKSIDECYRVAKKYTAHKISTGISLGVRTKSGKKAHKTPFTKAKLGKKMDNVHLSVHPTDWWIERFLSRNKKAKLICRVHKTFIIGW